MTEKKWEAIKFERCIRVGEEVELQAQVVYPADHLPDSPPRITAHRCTYGVRCNLMGKPTCVWSGTNPAYDPFEG